MPEAERGVTLYSLWKKGREARWVRVYIAGASWYGAQRAAAETGGLRAADAYTVRVPALTAPKGYLPPERWRAREAPDGYWSVHCGDVAVKGLVTDETDAAAALRAKYTECFVVTGVSVNLRGPRAVRQIKITGA